MPVNRREFIAASVAGAVVLQREMKAFAAPAGPIQVTVDATKSGAPINPMIFGGYMEPATTQVWAEILTDRKFANAITSAPTPPPANPFFRRFFGEPFKPVGPEGTVEMDTARPFVGKHSPRVKLDSSEPHGIRQSKLRVGGGMAYEGRVILSRRSRHEHYNPFGVGARRRRLGNDQDPFVVSRVPEIFAQVYTRC